MLGFRCYNITNAVLDVRNSNVLLELSCVNLIELLLMLEEVVIVFFYILCHVNCVIPESIHTPHGWSIEIPRGGGGGGGLKGRNFRGVWGGGT